MSCRLSRHLMLTHFVDYCKGQRARDDQRCWDGDRQGGFNALCVNALSKGHKGGIDACEGLLVEETKPLARRPFPFQHG